MRFEDAGKPTPRPRLGNEDLGADVQVETSRVDGSRSAPSMAFDSACMRSRVQMLESRVSITPRLTNTARTDLAITPL